MADISDNVKEAEQEQLQKQGVGELESDLTLFEKALLGSFNATKKVATGVIYLTTVYTLVGLNPLITSMGFMAGETIIKSKTGEGVKLKNLKNEAYSGAIMGTFLHSVFTAVPYISGLPLKIAYSLAVIPVFNFMHFGIDHNIRKYTPTTLYQKTLDEGVGSVLSETYKESIKPKFGKSLKAIATKPVPGLFPTGVVINTIAPYSVTAKMIGAFGLSTIYRSLTVEKPDKKEEDKPYATPGIHGNA
ncbi:hypothetical protein HQ529_01635 [Candidatus Woesearchaeota archaeon]|nr:hypothetical protein [Candidatus Woesearchaeota archaeon]